MSNSYKIDLDAVGDYIEDLRRFKKNLEKKQSEEVTYGKHHK